MLLFHRRAIDYLHIPWRRTQQSFSRRYRGGGNENMSVNVLWRRQAVSYRQAVIMAARNDHDEGRVSSWRPNNRMKYLYVLRRRHDAP